MLRIKEPYVLVEEINDFIEKVGDDPELFDERVKHVLDTAENWIDEKDDTPQEAAEKIVRESLKREHFRYNGARLAIHLIEFLKSDKTGRFRDCLLGCCRDRIDSLIKSGRNTYDLHENGTHQENGVGNGNIIDHVELYANSLSLFVGDVYTRDGSQDLGLSLIELLKWQVDNPSDGRLKVCGQVLKLCGHYLCGIESIENITEAKIPYIYEKLREYLDIEEQREVPSISSPHQPTGTITEKKLRNGIELSNTTLQILQNVVFLYDTNWMQIGNSENAFDENVAAGDVANQLFNWQLNGQNGSDGQNGLDEQDEANIRCYFESQENDNDFQATEQQRTSSPATTTTNNQQQHFDHFDPSLCYPSASYSSHENGGQQQQYQDFYEDSNSQEDDYYEEFERFLKESGQK